jgi:SRSO17 transposase
MTPEQILSLNPQLSEFLEEFDDCFARSEPRGHLASYVRGQLSDLPRKSVQPIADFAGTPRRTLQEFLSWSEWDHAPMRDRVQRFVARHHADPHAIGILDESGHPKSGNKTACVQRQWCGNTGKLDNCVVSVHLAYASYDTRFRAMLDGALFLPEKGWDDPVRRAEAGIPTDLTYRPKWRIALELLDRALGNGMVFGWITADEWYSISGEFLGGLEARKQRYVVEVRANFYGRLYDPRRDPRARLSKVKNLCSFSPPMMRQPWQRVYVKETDKGPMVWEIKRAPIWLQRSDRVLGPYWLIYARNALERGEVRYFVSNASPGTPLEAIVHVAFSRWPVERCLEDEKDELGLSHFEVRKYDSIMRHLSITQVSHLFLARQTERLRGEKPGDHVVPGSNCCKRDGGRVAVAQERSHRTVGERLEESRADSRPKQACAKIPYQDKADAPGETRNRPGGTPLLRSSLKRQVALSY